MSAEQAPPLFALKDIRTLLTLSLGSAVATAVPARFDRLAVEAMLPLYRSSEVALLMERNLPSSAGLDFEAMGHHHARMRLEDAWGRLRGVGPREWRPTVELVGDEQVRAALRQGRGVILWQMRLASATAIKQAFFRAGLPLVHLSRAQHGAGSNTRLAASAVSPLFCRAENPYLNERIRIPLGGSVAYLSELRERLRRNSCVSIFGEHEGRGNCEARFLRGRKRFATGAPSLAWLENSALFTVHAERTEPFAYRVVVHEPIPVDRAMKRKDFAAHAVGTFASRLEERIVDRPADWQGWSYWDDLGVSASEEDLGADS